MSRLTLLSLSILLIAGMAGAQTPPAPQTAPQQPQQADAPASRSYPTFQSTLAELAANPVTKAIVDKHLPDLTSHESFSYISGYTLTQFGEKAQGASLPGKLAAIEAELKALAPA